MAKIKIALINNYSSAALKTSAIMNQRLENILMQDKDVLCAVDVFTYTDLPSLEKLNEEYHALVLSGSNYFLSDPETWRKFEPEMVLIRQCQLPTLGICYGLQLALSAYGGVIYHNAITDEESDTFDIEKTLSIKHDPEHFFPNAKFQAYLSHYEYFSLDDAVINEHFLIGAESQEDNRHYIQYARHLNKPLFCVQFHPETFPTASAKCKKDGKVFLQNFLNFVYKAKKN